MIDNDYFIVDNAIVEKPAKSGEIVESVEKIWKSRLFLMYKY